MPLQLTDRFAIARGSTAYHVTSDDVISLVRDSLGTVEHEAATITARDALTGLSQGDHVFVTDASADASVNAGWAVYRWNGTAFLKIAEAESIDVSLTVNLGTTVSPTEGVVTNTAGTDATIPLVDATNAGLASPEMFNNSHVAVVASANGGIAVNAATQAISLAIETLPAAP